LMLMMFLLFTFLLLASTLLGSNLAFTPARRLSDYTTETVQLSATSCTIFKPWTSTPSINSKFPIILWLNGYEPGVINGTISYEHGLIGWALSGPYIIIADNNPNPQKSDAPLCLSWIVEQSSNSTSEFYQIADQDNIGLAGHSSGAGLVFVEWDLKKIFNVKGMLLMNPWSPGKKPKQRFRGGNHQSSPTFILGCLHDSFAPVNFYAKITWKLLKASKQGGVFSILNGGTHTSEAIGPNFAQGPFDFGRFQQVSNLWWDRIFHDNKTAGAELVNILTHDILPTVTNQCGCYPPLGTPPFKTQYHFTPTFVLP